jgi:hypothetical protein
MGLGSGIRKKPIPDPGSRGSKRHRIPDPQHWQALNIRNSCEGNAGIVFSRQHVRPAVGLCGRVQKLS